MNHIHIASILNIISHQPSKQLTSAFITSWPPGAGICGILRCVRIKNI